MAELRVLVCDDDSDMLELMLRRLDKMGFKPDRAGDGGIATTLIKENLYDLIVTDIYMPEATGLEVLALAKQRDPQVQVVIVTASATLDNAIDALNHGAFGYLSKPFDHLSVFDNTVARALEFRQLIMANKRMAEAQKMRGDMLEDEVAKRVGQLREKQQGLLDLLNCLPDGIVVVEEGGKLLMTSPAAEQWLARDRRTEDQPITQFLGQVHSEWAESSGYAQLGQDALRLLSVDYPHPNGRRRKAVLIRRAEETPASTGPGTLAAESMAALKEGLAWIFRQKLSGPMQERVKELANHVSTLEQTGGGTAATGAQLPRSTSPLAPATLPVYLRHEPKLDAPGANWEEAEPAAAGQNGKPAEAGVEAAAALDRSAAVEPATQPHGPSPADTLMTDEAGTGTAETQPETLTEEMVELAQGSVQVAEAEAEPEPATESAAEPAGELPQPLEPESVDMPIELSTAPTRVLSARESVPQARIEQAAARVEAPVEAPAAEQPDATLGPKTEVTTDTGRVPLWQRFSKGHGATTESPAPAKRSRRAARHTEPEPPVMEPQVEEPEQVVELAARLGALGGTEEAEPVAAKVPEPRGRPSIASAKAKAVVQARATAAEAPRVSQPPAEPAQAPASRARPKIWPPQLPSQDPDFDPELDVTG